MVTSSLNLNSLTIDSNGRVSFSGLSSGIDFQKAVDAIISAKKIPIDTMSTKVDTNNKQITALKSLQTLIFQSIVFESGYSQNLLYILAPPDILYDAAVSLRRELARRK